MDILTFKEKKAQKETRALPETWLCVQTGKVCLFIKGKEDMKENSIRGLCVDRDVTVCVLYMQNTAHEYRMEFCFSCLLALECFEIT